MGFLHPVDTQSLNPKRNNFLKVRLFITATPTVERCTEIEKANRMLLEKMTNIMAS